MLSHSSSDKAPVAGPTLQSLESAYFSTLFHTSSHSLTAPASSSAAPAMNLTEQVLRVLDTALSLQGRATRFEPSTPLLGALPELDSMAVLALITGLENHFGVAFDDDDLNGSVFATVGSLSDLVEQTLSRQGP